MTFAGAARAALACLWLIAVSAGVPPGAAAAGPAGKGAPAGKPRAGLQIPGKEFRARVRTVALVPLFFSRIPADAPALKARYDSLLAGGLKGAGIRAIPGRVWTDEKRGVTDSAGIAVDRKSGRPDLKKADAIVAETKRRVAQRHGGFDAILYPSVRRAASGWFLHVDIVSPRDALLYQSDGEILRVQPPANAPKQLPPYDSFATNPSRDARAVAGALGPLVNGIASK